ncbi:MAG: alpha/beta hydrolase, partial [Longimicrobiales bacterium]|nr:alpha/beta hydrolase [Longimicrobiales bacterium]
MATESSMFPHEPPSELTSDPRPPNVAHPPEGTRLAGGSGLALTVLLLLGAAGGLRAQASDDNGDAGSSNDGGASEEQVAMTVTRDVDYRGEGSHGEDRDLLDIYMPEDATRAPVVVFFHGGALTFGSKDAGQVLAEQMIPKGVGVVSANYRLSPEVMHPTHVEDAAAAVAWTVENIPEYGGNP